MYIIYRYIWMYVYIRINPRGLLGKLLRSTHILNWGKVMLLDCVGVCMYMWMYVRLYVYVCIKSIMEFKDDPNSASFPCDAYVFSGLRLRFTKKWKFNCSWRKFSMVYLCRSDSACFFLSSQLVKLCWLYILRNVMLHYISQLKKLE